MRIPPRIASLGALGALATTLLIGGTAVAASPTAPVVTHRITHSVTSHVTAVGSICYSDLPSQAHDTLDLIASDGPYPYHEDGTVFQNREGVLPAQGAGYYHEYTVVTPGSDDRGARRIVAGEETDEDYYTSDHYESFDLVDFTC
jgi:ribonuclease T1